MAIKWICTRCGKKIGDGIPKKLPKLDVGEKPPIPVDWKGICPYCEGVLEDLKE